MHKWIFFALFFWTGVTHAADDKKVVVIGFDGADHQIVEQMMAEGELPNLAGLRDRGGYSSLMPTNPPQTPVSWSTFATGLNPGKTGIFDFIKRKEGSYIPDFALRGETTKQVLMGEKNPLLMPAAAFFLVTGVLLLLLFKLKTAVKLPLALVAGGVAAAFAFHVFTAWIPPEIPAVYTVRQGKPIWKILEEKGRTASIIRLPVTFPAEPLNGQMISGLAVPDIRGTVGKPSIYTNDPNWKADDNQFSIELKFLTGEAPYDTTVLGPPNKFFYKEAERREAAQQGRPYDIPKDFHLPIQIQVGDGVVTPVVHGKSFPLKVKEWSDWVEFTYEINPVIKLKSAARFYLDQLEGQHFKLYMTPVHLHPDNPLAMSYPADLAKQVWAEEPYKTMGWALDTWSIGNDLMDETHFLEDVDKTVTRYEKMMEQFLADNDRDLFVQVFSFTDRVGHVLWRYWDTEHPLYDPEKGPIYQKAIRDAYRRMDTIVGKALSMIDLDKTMFLVCSDHGFSSWRYQFNYNTWLVKNGYMKLKKNVLGVSMKLDDLQNSNTPLSFVDWENTKAYAMGLGMVFINLEGREPEGSVKPEEYDALCKQLAEDFKAFVDEKTGLHPVRDVHLRDDIYRDYDPGTTPDLRVSTAVNYRVSWDTTLGGMPEELTEINPRNWSGDHCSLDPRDVKGILFSSEPIQTQDPHMADICPSILKVLGIDHGIDMDGRIIF